MFLGVDANRFDDFAAAKHFQLDGGVAALELESIDADLPLPLVAARGALAENERNGGDDQHRGEDRDQTHGLSKSVVVISRPRPSNTARSHENRSEDCWLVLLAFLAGCGGHSPAARTRAVASRGG